MLIIKAESTSSLIKTALQEAKDFAKMYNCIVSLRVNGKDIEIGADDDLYEIHEEYKNGFYD